MTTETAGDAGPYGHDIAEALAPGWERRRPFVEEVAAPVRAWLVRELAPQPGQTILELAAGAGDTGYEAAAVLGDGGRLLCTDFSEGMVGTARRRAAELGVRNVEHHVMDAERLDLPDASVDGVLCRYGYMLMADAAAALAETRRVLRPGGRVALAVWGPPERNPFFAAMAMGLVAGGHLPPPDPDGPGIFSMAAEARTRAMLETAGFGTVRTEEVPVTFRLAGLDEYVDIVRDTAGSIALVLRGLSAPELDALRGRLGDAFAPFAQPDGGYVVPGLTLAAVAT